MATPLPDPLCPWPHRFVPDLWMTEGQPDLAHRPLLALCCSRRLPATLVLRAYDMAGALRKAGVPVISGFHTPIERDCLEILLRGRQPIVICPARSLERYRIPRAWRGPLAEGRLLILSFFHDEPRVTAELAEARNQYVAALARALLVIHAEPGGKTEALCRMAIRWGTPVYTLAHEANAHLVELGVQALHVDEAGRLAGELARAHTS